MEEIWGGRILFGLILDWTLSLSILFEIKASPAKVGIYLEELLTMGLPFIFDKSLDDFFYREDFLL